MPRSRPWRPGRPGSAYVAHSTGDYLPDSPINPRSPIAHPGPARGRPRGVKPLDCAQQCSPKRICSSRPCGSEPKRNCSSRPCGSEPMRNCSSRPCGREPDISAWHLHLDHRCGNIAGAYLVTLGSVLCTPRALKKKQEKQRPVPKRLCAWRLDTQTCQTCRLPHLCLQWWREHSA